MKKLLLPILLLSVSLLASAQDSLYIAPALAKQELRNPKLEYGLDFLFHFDNREFDYPNGKYMRSSTIFSVVGAPTVGFSIQQGDDADHRVTAGFDYYRDMGEGSDPDRDLREIIFNYDFHKRFRNGALFEAVAGVFPRRYMEGEYSEVFFTDSLLFYDHNLDGAILKYMTRNFYMEFGADWMGKAGVTRKERFQLFFAGDWIPAHWFKMGFAGTFYHYAGSRQAPGVVDNHLLQTYIEFDAGKLTHLQELSIKFSPLLSYQYDRVRDPHPMLPCGGEMVITTRNWNVWLQNTTYVGDNLMPYYYGVDTGGNPYAGNLYLGSPFYRKFYNLLELYWEPKLTEWLFFRASARFHFDEGGFMGCQQKLSLFLNLDAFRHPGWGAGRIGMTRREKVFRSYYMY
ncbi:MAG: hypothetical protein J5771_05705 [Bacteroidales bacterium]|nr:hypothetical protein [Bacteroidales bacterium]